MATPKSLYIQGIEVTQAIQYYRSDMHLTDPVDRGKDNMLRLVANKTAWVRVYVRSSAGAPIKNVTGTLRVERTGPDKLLANLTPQPPGSITAFVEPEAATGVPYFTPYTFYRAERSSLAMTLNFIIPANQMCGYLRLTARASAPDGQTHEMMTFIDATLHQTIHFRAIMIGYKGKDPANPANTLTINSPSLVDLQTTSELTLRMYPISEVTYEILESRYIDYPLESVGCGGGGVGWSKLMNLLDQLVAIYGEHPGYLYYGLIAPGVPGGGGCNSGKAAAGYVESPLQQGANRVMVHEIGHFFTGHAPCGLPSGDSNDSKYPEYEPYGSASIGEYGLDINSGEIMPPEDYKDIMSYCPPEVWVSIYSHKLRINHPLFNPTRVCPPGKIQIYYPPKIPIDVTFPYVRAQQRPVIHVFGIQDILGNITIQNVFRTLSYGHAHGLRTSLIAVLQDADGQLLASAAMVRRSGRATEDSGCGCCDDESAGEFLISAILPDVAPGSVLRVLKDGQEIWRKEAPATQPRLTGLSAEILNNERLVVRWRGESAGPTSPLEYWVRWSGNAGTTWNILGTGIKETQAEFAFDALPGADIQIQVVAHDGFYSTASDPVAVRLPVRTPIVTILYPKEGDTIPAGGGLRLWAVTTASGEELDPQDVRWLVNGREVGRGLEAWTVAPADGMHSCSLQVKGDPPRKERRVQFKTAAIQHSQGAPWET